MKSKRSLGLIIGIVIGIATEISSQNISAALSIGTGSGILIRLLTILEVEKNNRA